MRVSAFLLRVNSASSSACCLPSCVPSWSPKRRARQSALCRQWQPWRFSTGPRTAVVAQQANVAHQQQINQADGPGPKVSARVADPPSLGHGESAALENELIAPRPKEGTPMG
jgi:hypothetical protein